jgi:FixJ family two-component response regulator
MHRRTVFIIDDDPSVRDSLSLLLSLRGYATAVFGCAEDFLKVLAPDWRGCVVADIRMPGMSGLDLQKALLKHATRLPVVIMTGHGNIAAAREAFKARAVDFVEKPFDNEYLLAAIDRALAGVEAEAASRPGGAAPDPLESLSAREQEVMDLLVQGLAHATIGERLGISPRTVEVHKSRVLQKLGARNLADLIRIVFSLREQRANRPAS